MKIVIREPQGGELGEAVKLGRKTFGPIGYILS